VKKSLFSLVAMYTLSGMVYAGGGVAQVEEPVAPIMEESSPYYLGIGFGQIAVNDDTTSEEFSSSSMMLQAGYQFNRYVALEGRYTYGFNTDYDKGNTAGIPGGYDGDLSNWGLYVKPMYPIGQFSIYALLGYGGVMLDNLAGGDAYEDGFQWGAGLSYSVTEHISLFADYVKLYDDKGFDYRALSDDIEADSWTVGMSYRF